MDEKTLQIGESIHLDTLKNKVMHGTEVIHLSPMETQVLYVLGNNLGHPVSSQFIINEVWDAQDVSTSYLHHIVFRTRIKLGNIGRKLVCIRGYGYMLNTF